MEELEKKVVLKNGAVLLRNYTEESENSLTVTLVFDRPIQKEDLAELRELNSYSVITKAVVRKGWSSDDKEATILVAHKMRIGFSEGGREWHFQFDRDETAEKNRTLH